MFFMKKELLQEILSKFQDKLLDLSKRNKMINSNFQSRSRTHFRIIDEIPDLLYKKLSKGGMEFKPLPSLDDENPEDENTPEFKEKLAIMEQENEEYIKTMETIENEQTDNLNEAREKALRKLKDKVRAECKLPPISTKHTSIEEHCTKQGLNPNYDLPTPTPVSKNELRWNDKKIQTLMLPDNLKRYLDSIYKQHRSTLRERGVNILYFCFGFLEWKESPNSTQKLYSPILTLQADLSKKSTKLAVNGVGSELNINQTLNEKLKKDFNCKLPEFKKNEENQDNFLIDKYLQKVKKKIATSHNWKVKNWVSFGLYNAKNISIYKDIRNILLVISEDGPTGCLKNILLGNNSTPEPDEEYNLDSKKTKKELPALIESADSSQYSAILDVLKGKNLVIQGPPGTGKSQTITNLIASLILKGKKVLFVAQKQAALDVVSNKLKANGLSDYILELFSAKANKKRFIESIKKRLELENPKNPRNLEEKINNFWETKQKLNEYAHLMSEQFKNTDRNVQTFYGVMNQEMR